MFNGVLMNEFGSGTSHSNLFITPVYVWASEQGNPQMLQSEFNEYQKLQNWVAEMNTLLDSFRATKQQHAQFVSHNIN